MISILLALSLSPDLKACVERKRAYFTKLRIQDAEANCKGTLRQDCTPGTLRTFTERFLQTYGPGKNYGVKECQKEAVGR